MDEWGSSGIWAAGPLSYSVASTCACIYLLGARFFALVSLWYFGRPSFNRFYGNHARAVWIIVQPLTQFILVGPRPSLVVCLLRDF